MTNLKNRSIAGSAALIATFLTVAATAAPLRAEPVKVAVAYSDLDIRSEAGAAALQARIGRAARQACGADDAGTRLRIATCRHQAVKAAQAQLAMQAGNADIRLAAR